MIYDDLKNAELYFSKEDSLLKAIKYAMEFDLSIADGDYEVNDSNMIAKVQSYETSPAEQRRFEAHKNHIDIQILRQGQERQDVVVSEKLEAVTEYDPKKDVIKFSAPEHFSSLAMSPGKFAVFFPQDIHRPNCNLNGTSKVRKICMKVKI